MPDLPKLSLLPERYAVCRLPLDADLPEWLGAAMMQDTFWSLTRAIGEVSAVVAESFAPPSTDEIPVKSGWRILQVEGPLPFEMVGVLAGLVVPLADAQVSVFTISTYNTDYLLVQETALPVALAALHDAGYSVVR
ncbi:MAG: ACT domain-containing protein [Armatimonadaceae bacterium]